MASLALHNMLRTESQESYTPQGFIDSEVDGILTEGDWRNDAAPNIAPIKRERGGSASLDGENIRNIFCDFCNGPGQLPWQWEIINR